MPEPEEPILMAAFEIPDRMSADIQMIAVWQQAWKRFEPAMDMHQRRAAIDWLASWAHSQLSAALPTNP